MYINLWVCKLNLQYDANDNLVTGDGKYRVYNGFNRLWKVYNGSNSSDELLEELTYHPLEERVLLRKVFDNGQLRQRIFYLNENFVRIHNSSGTYNFTYIYQEGQLEDFVWRKNVVL